MLPLLLRACFVCPALACCSNIALLWLVVAIYLSGSADKDIRPAAGNLVCYRSSVSLDVSRDNSVLYTIVLASRGREGCQLRGLGVAEASPSTVLVVAQPVSLETSSPDTGKG